VFIHNKNWLERVAVTTIGYFSCRAVMEYEWDEAKRLANLRKYGIDFTDVPDVFDGDRVTVEDDRYSYAASTSTSSPEEQGSGMGNPC
jgi:hypothetical protein